MLTGRPPAPVSNSEAEQRHAYMNSQPGEHISAVTSSSATHFAFLSSLGQTMSKYWCVALAFSLSISLVYASPTVIGNVSVVLPAGVSNHGDPNLICQPAKWTDIAIFFLGNYASHAVTVVLEPGTDTIGTCIITLSALLLPGAGLFRALQAIMTRSVFAEDDLQTAARGRALCTLIDKRKINRATYTLWFESGLLLRTSGMRALFSVRTVAIKPVLFRKLSGPVASSFRTCAIH